MGGRVEEPDGGKPSRDWLGTGRSRSVAVETDPQRGDTDGADFVPRVMVPEELIVEKPLGFRNRRK